MDDGTRKLCQLGVVCVSFALVLLLFTIQAQIDQIETLQQEAVKRGHAEYVPTVAGGPANTWRWKELPQ